MYSCPFCADQIGTKLDCRQCRSTHATQVFTTSMVFVFLLVQFGFDSTYVSHGNLTETLLNKESIVREEAKQSYRVSVP